MGKQNHVIVKEDLPPEIESRKARLFPIYKAAVSQKKKALLIADKLYIDGIKYTVDSLHLLPECLQPKNLCVRRLSNSILFHGCDAVFSSFYPSDFMVNGKKYNSVEQYFQYHRALFVGKDELAEKIMMTESPFEQHRIGR